MSQRAIQYQAFVDAATAGLSTPPLSWAPEYPDSVRRRARIALSDITCFAVPSVGAAFVGSGGVTRPSTITQYQQKAGPVRFTAPTTPTFFGAAQADMPPRPSAPPFVGDGSLAWDPATQQATPTWWLGSYPDLLAATRQMPQALQAAILDRLTVPNDWDTMYPDLLRRQRESAAESAVATVLDRLTTPEAWKPTFPDRIDGAPRAAEGGITAILDTLKIASDWYAKYPDHVDVTRFATEAQRWFDLHPAPITVPTAQLGWRGAYPDWLPLQRPVEFPAFETGATASVLPLVRPLVWLGRYADLAPGARAVNGPPASAFDVFPRPGVVALSWAPEYPDRAVAAARAAVAEIANILDRLTVPEDWQTTYPAMLASVRVMSDVQTAPFPQVTPHAWSALYADMVRAVAGVLDSRPTQPWVQATTPSARAVYPDAASRPTFDVARQVAWAGVTPSVFRVPALAWLGVWPDFARILALPVADMPFEADRGRLFVPAVTTGWQPTYADTARAPQPINVGPALAFLRLIIRGPEVIRFADEIDHQAVLLDLYAARDEMVREMAMPFSRLYAAGEYARTAGFQAEIARQPTFTDINEDT